MTRKNYAAGMLMFKKEKNTLQYFLVHPGGPFFSKKDTGVWTIPKGVPENKETPIETAKREFGEETGVKPLPPYIYLGNIKQKGGKMVEAWAFEYTENTPINLNSNTFKIEWPPKSGNKAIFPEVDKGMFFNYEKALVKINPNQAPFLDRLRTLFNTQNGLKET
ncbi:NUDIX domain-containing protein [Cytophagaceae bacterium ABcell3]|nr:NUDIX domain-containing protein [Cytophagaceae bacterium ABcell3]